MGLFDKLKNIFIEEELVDDDVPTLKKKVEDVSPVKIEEQDKEETKEIPSTFNSDIMSDRSLIDTKENFKFPIIFEDDDFKEEKRTSKSINVLERENNKYEPEIKKELKSQKKAFKPSPVISPVYGILDKNYSKEDISSKEGVLTDYSEKIDIDYVIKKAYGEPKTEEVIVTRESKKKVELKEDLMDLYEEKETIEIPDVEEYSIEQIDEKIKSIDELLKDTDDDDFYSLVDSMYKDEEGDEEE